MHRFGRSAQKKMNDRWGGVFILAVVLAVVGAWQLGGYLGSLLGDEKQAAMEPVPSDNVNLSQGPVTPTQTPLAQEFQVHFVQVGAFRSEGAARNFVKDLAAMDLTAAVTERNGQGLVRVYVGPYMTGEAADEAKARLTEGEIVLNPFTVTMNVDHKPEAVMAMTGSANPELQSGLDTLNAYLYEAGAWFAKRSAGEPADGAALAGLGQDMMAIAQSLAKEEVSNPVGKFIAMADIATTNAADIEVAANASPGSAEFQKAMSGYVSLLERYHTFYMESGSEQ